MQKSKCCAPDWSVQNNCISDLKPKPLYKIIYICLITVFLKGSSSAASNQQQPDPKKLELTWKVYQNNYLGKEQTLNSLSIRNTGAENFPALGWKIYFNYGKRTTAIAGNDAFTISHINGGLYTLTPGKSFAGLPAGQQIEWKYLSNSWVVNESEAPQGFYLVWDNAPSVGIALNAPVISAPDERRMERYKGDKELTQEQLFVLNERGRKSNPLASSNGAELLSAGKIFPKPLYYKETAGYYILNPSSKIYADQNFSTEEGLLSDDLKVIFGKKPGVSSGSSAAAIILKKDTALRKDEYKLSVSAAGVVISGRGAREIHYGLQSLKVLIEPEVYAAAFKQKTVRLKCVEVQDRPAFAFRGVMLDVARNFQPKQEILKLIDLLSLYKLTTLHLHLNDDEGWRVQIKSLPELTDIGSKRGHTVDEQDKLIPSYGSGPMAGVNSGTGFYSREDFIDILKYAAQRHISVIPEIETPGHARAAIVSMQARYRKFMKSGDTLKAREYLLRDEIDTSVYRSVQQWNDHVIDVSMPSVYHFLETVSNELIDMYQQAGAPLETIHFGGDEVPAGVWTGSPAVNAFKAVHPEIRQPADLWNYFFGRLCAMLGKKGLYLSGWEETALRKSPENPRRWQPNPLFLDQNFHVNVWNNMSGNEDLAYRLANSGYKVILSFVTNFYFDMAYTRKFDEPGFNWGGLIDLEQSFKFIPFDYLRNQRTDYINKPLPKSMLAAFEHLTAAGQKNIAGIQGLLWTETVQTPERLEYMYLPRLLALSERAWSASPAWVAEKDTVRAGSAYVKDWSRFTCSVSREMKRLDHYSGGYQYRVPTPAVRIRGNKAEANTDLPGFQIRYTTDGSVPDVHSRLYLKPLSKSENLRFRAFNTLGRGGKVTAGAAGE
ncbi:hexosaminidase [Pedobacter westerhofensis]|uniref:beta-N-acetylhexosaminidase n=1 Tax=Pedobacter westerhofensis TaxID=425512 RepID=A0A521FJ13_9SPHI|nr:hexosaminidase [Pedobacter westerhofensis]